MLKSTVLACAGLVMLSGVYCQAQTTEPSGILRLNPNGPQLHFPRPRTIPAPTDQVSADGI